MTDRRLTDAQIAAALRAHLPAHAQTGLRSQVFDAIDSTPQHKPMPSLLGRLTDADQVARRRTILLAAALLLALALATAIGVGAILDSRRTDIDQLSLEPPAEVDQLSLQPPAEIDGWVVGSYANLVDLPALSLMVIETEGTKGRWSYDGAGHVRLDHYFSPTDDEPGLFQLFGDDTMSEITDFKGQRVWVDHTGQGNPLSSIASATGLNVFCDTPWTYVGLEYVIGRPTHHVACGDSAMWLDVETRIPLKAIQAQPAEIGPTIRKDVLELAIGPQPADLFIPPSNLPVVSEEAYQCSMMTECVSPAPATPEPSRAPIVTPPPATGEFAVPAVIDAFVADVLAGYATLPAMSMDVLRDMNADKVRVHDVYDGTSHARIDWYYDPNQPPTVYLVVPGHAYESYGLNDEGRPIWVDHGAEPYPGVDRLGLGQRCVEGWTHLGFDLVNGRPAHHLECDGREYWVDREWNLVVRSRVQLDPLVDDTSVTEVVDVQFGAPPPGSFDLTDDALICSSRGRDCKDMSGKPYVAPSPGPSASPSPEASPRG